jgi:formylglycine-generating enzyme
MLSGEPPYTAETPTGQMLQHITQPVPDVLQLRPDLPPETQETTNKTMAKDREERYQTAAELATAVSSLLDTGSMTGENAAIAAVKTGAAEPDPTEVADTNDELPAKMEPQLETALDDGAEKVYLDTPPENLAEGQQLAEPIVAAAVMGASDAVPPLETDSKDGGPPGWIWWVGALALLLIAAFSLRAILSGGGNDEEVSAVAATGAFEAAIAVALTGNAPTTTPMEEEVGEEQGRDSQAGDVEAMPAAALQPTETPLPTEEPSPTAEPTETPTEEPSPTLTPDPDVLPLAAELGDTWERPADGITMVYVPEGSCPMGSEEGYDDEKPVHDVRLDDYWIDSTEITNDQFAQFVRETGYETTAEKEGSGFTYNDGEFEEITGADWQHPQGLDSDINGLADHPVVQVSWYDAEAYCEWAETRLPTEAEWAYAARGPEGYRYPWGEQVSNCDLAQFGSCAGQTVPTGSLPRGASWVGALDMSGNVIEWTNDWYDENYYANSPEISPQGPDNGEFKVLRGGSWLNDEISVRGAIRGIANAVDRRDYVGFRCVVSPGS